MPLIFFGESIHLSSQHFLQVFRHKETKKETNKQTFLVGRWERKDHETSLTFFRTKSQRNRQHPHTSHPRNRARLMLQSTFLPCWEVSAANLKCSPNLIRWRFFLTSHTNKMEWWMERCHLGCVGKEMVSHGRSWGQNPNLISLRWLKLLLDSWDVYMYLPSPLVSLRGFKPQKNPNETFAEHHVLVVQKILPK